VLSGGIFSLKMGDLLKSIEILPVFHRFLEK
jgi:hypothetical protein